MMLKAYLSDLNRFAYAWFEERIDPDVKPLLLKDGHSYDKYKNFNKFLSVLLCRLLISDLSVRDA